MSFTIYSCAFLISSLCIKKGREIETEFVSISLSTANTEKLEIHESPIFACGGQRKKLEIPCGKTGDFSFIG
jgi:hypothetical protein